ncbi:fructosamine kinase family protein [Thermus antranikianii]|uniref:Phosphotransferase n=1 Tax=Thermus antranikianii TaxID=88190 RepID=A0ABY7RP62_9DEIN|nr:fructosamine kinase family protein [Thermus antranikianii]QWK21825.1 MAG: fructosamine kinase family protein [Thermus antranikianii]WCM39456.1 phosphotransferase [Thermus antranikianii]
MDPRKLLERAGLEAKGVPQPLYGGDISRVYRLGAYVVKLSPSPPLGLFPAEARGLRALAERGVRVPRVFFAAEEGLILEYLPEGPPDWEGLARMLAGLHRQREALYRAEAGFLGTFPLPGGEGREWTEFFFSRCIEPLLQATWDRLEGLGPKVEALFQRPLPAEGPAPLHGDLWHGNVRFTPEGPALLDPSFFVGERGVDLAMMRLFGGFPKVFWQAYQALYPIPEEVEEALPRYQVYYLLAHVHFFGKGYLGSLWKAISAS